MCYICEARGEVGKRYKETQALFVGLEFADDYTVPPSPPQPADSRNVRGYAELVERYNARPVRRP